MKTTLRFLAVLIAVFAVAVAASGQQTTAAKKKEAAVAATKAKTVHRAVHPTASSAKIGSAKASNGKSAASKGGASKANTKAGAKSRKTVVARRPPTQQQPTADRYKEIQQALVDKGYFQGPVDGAWNTGSVEALKRFQKDQNLDADGKIGALSLIALGLGPRRVEAPAQAAPASGDRADPPPVALPQQQPQQ